MTSSGDDAVAAVEVYHRRDDHDATMNTSDHPCDITVSSSAGTEPGQEIRRTEQKPTIYANIEVTGTMPSKTSERSTEEGRRAQMKHYCLEQLTRSSMPELDQRRRGKRHRKMAIRMPDSVQTLKVGAPSNVTSVASREYASLVRPTDKYSLVSATTNRRDEETSNTLGATVVPHEYSQRNGHAATSASDKSSPDGGMHKWSTTVRDYLPQSSINADGAKEKSPNTSAIGQTQHHRNLSSNTLSNMSQTLDRISSDNWEHKRKVQARSSQEGRIQSFSTAGTDCSKPSCGVSTLNRTGRLSVTITDNEEEPEIQKKIDLRQISGSTSMADYGHNSRREDEERTQRSRLYVVLSDRVAANRMNGESPPTDFNDSEGNGTKSSLYEVTTNVNCAQRHGETAATRLSKSFRSPNKQTSTLMSSSPPLVDASVQVGKATLRSGGGRMPAPDKSNVHSFDGGIQSPSADSDRTATRESSSPEFFSSKQYLRGPGKEVRGPSASFQRSRRDSFGDIHGGNPPAVLNRRAVRISPFPDPESSSKEYFRRSRSDIWRESMPPLQRSRRKGSTDMDSGTKKRTSSGRAVAKKSDRRRHRHSAATSDSNHDQHLRESISWNNCQDKTADVIPAKTHQISDEKWKDKMVKTDLDKTDMGDTAKDEAANIAEYRAETYDLLPNADQAAGEA